MSNINLDRLEELLKAATDTVKETALSLRAKAMKSLPALIEAARERDRLLEESDDYRYIYGKRRLNSRDGLEFLTISSFIEAYR